MSAASSPEPVPISVDDLSDDSELFELWSPDSSVSSSTASSTPPPDPDHFETRLWRHFRAGCGQKEVKIITRGLGNMGTTTSADEQKADKKPGSKRLRSIVDSSILRSLGNRQLPSQSYEESIETSNGLIHVAFDGWRARNRHSLYGIACFFRDANSKPHKVILGLPETGRHLGTCIAKEVLQVFEVSGIKDKIGYFTLDNASNNDAALQVIGTELGLNGNNERPVVRFEGLSSYIRCIAHVLNLIVGDILSALQAGDIQSADRACDDLRANKDLDPDLSSLARLRIIVLWIDRSLQRRNRWKKLCRLEELPAELQSTTSTTV